MNADLRPILAEIRKLPRSEWKRVIKILREELKKSLVPAVTPEETSLQQMIEAGIIDRPVGEPDWDRIRNYQPVEIKGEPLSQTIIEMRREK